MKFCALGKKGLLQFWGNQWMDGFFKACGLEQNTFKEGEVIWVI